MLRCVLQAELRNGLKSAKFYLHAKELAKLTKPMSINRPVAISLGSLLFIALDPSEDFVAMAAERMLPTCRTTRTWQGHLRLGIIRRLCNLRFQVKTTIRFWGKHDSNCLEGLDSSVVFIATISGDDFIMGLQILELRQHLVTLDEMLLGLRPGVTSMVSNGANLERINSQEMIELYMIAFGLAMSGASQDGD